MSPNRGMSPSDPYRPLPPPVRGPSVRGLASLKLHGLTSTGSSFRKLWSACPRSGDSLFLYGLTSGESRKGD